MCFLPDNDMVRETCGRQLTDSVKKCGCGTLLLASFDDLFHAVGLSVSGVCGSEDQVEPPSLSLGWAGGKSDPTGVTMSSTSTPRPPRATGATATRITTETVAAAVNLLDARYDTVVYVADPDPSEWTRCCLRQADLILIGVSIRVDDTNPNPTAGTSEMFALRHGKPFTPVEFVLVHHDVEVVRNVTSSRQNSATASQDHSPVMPGAHHGDDDPSPAAAFAVPLTTDEEGSNVVRGSSSSMNSPLPRLADAENRNNNASGGGVRKRGRPRGLSTTCEVDDRDLDDDDYDVLKTIVPASPSSAKQTTPDSVPATPSKQFRTQDSGEWKATSLDRTSTTTGARSIATQLYIRADRLAPPALLGDPVLDKMSFASRRDTVAPGLRNFLKYTKKHRKNIDPGTYCYYFWRDRDPDVFLRCFDHYKFERESQLLSEAKPNFSSRHYLRPRLLRLRKYGRSRGFPLRWHHVRLSKLEYDFDRLARIVNHKAIAVVLGGGGAKGI